MSAVAVTRVGHGAGDGFDAERHRRETITRLRRENEHLRAHRAKLEAVLSIALRCATQDRRCGPLDLLAEIEEIVEAAA